MMQYPVKLELDTNGTVRVNFPDFSEVNTFGDDEEDPWRERWMRSKPGS